MASVLSAGKYLVSPRLSTGLASPGRHLDREAERWKCTDQTTPWRRWPLFALMLFDAHTMIFIWSSRGPCLSLDPMIGSLLPSLSFCFARHNDDAPNSISIVVRDRNSDKSTQKHVGGWRLCCDCTSLIFEASLSRNHHSLKIQHQASPSISKILEHLAILLVSLSLPTWMLRPRCQMVNGLVMRGPLVLRLAWTSTKTFSGSRCATRF